MIIVIDAMNKDRFSDVLEDMYQLRARVFGGRLGWEVQIKDDKEIDEFDYLDPAYVVGLDDDGHVVSCLRLLQTTGPHMLSDVFHAILDGQPPVRSANIWESTRFCVDTERLKGETHNTISHETSKIMAATLEYALRSGITDIITVIDPIINRVLKRSDNAPYGYVGSTKPMGKVSAMAALLDCTPERIARVRAFGEVTGDVFINEDDLRARLDARKAPVSNVIAMPARDITAKDVPSSAFLDYCRSQITAAQNKEELDAALALVDVLASRTSRRNLRDLTKLAQK